MRIHRRIRPRRIFFLPGSGYAVSMGRSIAPASQLIMDQIAEMEPLYGALRRSDQLILDDIFESVIQHQAAMANAASLLPLEALLILMQLEERKKFKRALEELYREVEEVRRSVRSAACDVREEGDQ